MENPGTPDGDNIPQGDSGAGGTLSAPTTVGGGDPSEIGGSSDIPRTVGPNVSSLALGTAADGAVTPRKTGVHPSETGGSPDIPSTVGPNVSNLALCRSRPLSMCSGLPLGVTAPLAAVPSLLPPSLGSQQRIPT